MNLLTDPWIPVTHSGEFKHVRLIDVLCHDEDWRISLPRDDMELAALQLVICLTQVILPPKDAKELREREKTSISESVYKKAIEPYMNWFVLDHPKHPFMQTLGVEAKEATPIQKLFPGMPEGNNHALFNDAGEIEGICAPCAAVALFNQAVNCPSFGGGFKPGLRGSAPIITLASGKTLRSTIWRNTLHSDDWFSSEYTSASCKNKPVWIDTIEEDETIHQSKIGMTRGLFWQAARISLNWVEASAICNACGSKAAELATSFDKEKFGFTVEGQWPHPHSPRKWETKKKEKQARFLSFTTTAPSWTQLGGMIIKKGADEEGCAQATVISQYASVFHREKLDMTIGGYRNNQASILERRHEIISLPSGWEDRMEEIEKLLNLAIAVKDALRKKLYGFSKRVTSGGAISSLAEDMFYKNSEPYIHATLREIDWMDISASRGRFARHLCVLARDIFAQVTQPYQHDPEMIKALAVAKRGLNKELSELASDGRIS